MKETFKISSKSDCSKVASAISYRIKNEEEVQLNAIGAGAVNQSIKAIAIARGFLAPCGIDLTCCPSFNLVDIKGEDKTMITLTIKKGTT